MADAFEIERDGETLIVTPVTDLREVDFPQIEAGAKEILALLSSASVKNVIMDFWRTDYYGSTALGFFVKLWKRVLQRGGRMVFCNISKHEREILGVMRLDELWAICGSRDGLPMGLQGTWLEGNTPDWMGDYHTDINLQMNYWLADRAGLGETFPAFADYCLAQLPAWNKITQEQFQDPRNRYRNTSEKVAGWTVAFSTNPYGGLGWWWHPAG